MKDNIVVFDGSRRMHIDLTLGALEEIDRIRAIQARVFGLDECDEFLDNFANRNFNPQRKQLHIDRFLREINNTQVMQRYSNSGKILLLDDDFYADGLDFCFGGHAPASRGLGYITISTARLDGENHSRDLLRHELGHMFGAARNGRGNTYEQLGSHCSNAGCVMQQKMSVKEAVEYADRRARANADTYCPDCEKGIRKFSYVR